MIFWYCTVCTAGWELDGLEGSTHCGKLLERRERHVPKAAPVDFTTLPWPTPEEDEARRGQGGPIDRDLYLPD